MSTQHTPGPWGNIGGNGRLLDIPIRATDLEKLGVSLVYIITDSPHRREVAQANARLIAAAPDLLEALQDLLFFDNGKPEFDAARAAIAKATGQKGGEA